MKNKRLKQLNMVKKSLPSNQLMTTALEKQQKETRVKGAFQQGNLLNHTPNRYGKAKKGL